MQTHGIATAVQLLERGVWRAPYLKDGLPLLVAVNRHGDVVKRVQLRPGVDVDRARTWLWELLDRVDPEPRPGRPVPLRLVPRHPARRPVVSVRALQPGRDLDPRSPLAKRRYLASLVRAAAAKAPPYRADEP